MTPVADLLSGALPDDRILTGDDIGEDYTHDEALTIAAQVPAAMVQPSSTAEVARILAVADEHGIAVTARGAGTGLCGGAVPEAEGILICLDTMNEVLEIDTENHVAVVQPGVTLADLDEATRPHGLVYPINPGEASASLGGNVATNAGGMRAVKYGVTRHQVLGLEAVLPGGEIIRTGGKFVKSTSGFDLTQLIVGSEGTLAIVTEITLKLQPRLEHRTTVLAPFRSLDDLARAVPVIIGSGLAPMILEYVDMMAMAATTANVGLDLGIADDITEAALAYLFVVLESTDADRLDGDVEQCGVLLSELGALDVYVLPPQAGAQLLDAREKAFWVAKQHGVNDIVDIVVPRAGMPDYLAMVTDAARKHSAMVAGAGHVGDGNVHLSVFQPDEEQRYKVMHDIFDAGLRMGGAISAEHGIGREKKRYFLEFEDPVKVALMKRIKAAFDPNGILNPGKVFD